MLSSARLGDQHDCPLPGHGKTPIVTASTDTIINFMGSARVGDVCGCGAVITTGFPSVQVNGRPMAHLGSPTSHGGLITTGSPDVGGGFFMGTAPGTAIINFATLGAFRSDGSVDDKKLAELLADPELIEKATSANALVESGTTSNQTGIIPAPTAEPKVCSDPDMMEPLAAYIADEINRNILDPSVLKIKKLLSYDAVEESRKQMDLPWYAKIGATNPLTIAASNKVAAMTL